MILNVQYPPIDAYDTPEGAIAGRNALHRKFLWFDTAFVQGQTVEAVSYGRWWFALRTSNGKRILITPGETLNVQLGTDPLPPTEPLPKLIDVKFEGFEGPATIRWKPWGQANLMLNRRIYAVTFHPHRLAITFKGSYCSWFWLGVDTDRNTPFVNWECAPD
jgi:hypothetical protein